MYNHIAIGEHCRYYLGCTDYWKHYGDEQDNSLIAVDLHEGGSLLGHVPGVDVPLYNTSGQYSTRLYADVASKWISEHDRRQPMFLYLAFQGAHSANNKFVQAPAELISRFDDRISPKAETCGQWELPLSSAACTKRAMRKTTAAEVVAIDDAVGAVVDALKAAGMYENSLIVFSSDNGGPTDGTNNNMMNNFPLRSGKGQTWEGGIRAVGFIHGAGLKETGVRSRALHHVSDWYLTFLAAANGGKPAAPILKPREVAWKPADGIDNWVLLVCNAAQSRLNACRTAHIACCPRLFVAPDARYLRHVKLCCMFACVAHVARR